MLGSHLDTVRGGGRFDGVAGVISALEVARLLNDSGETLRHPLEVVAFTAEEPSPFGISCVGSRAMIGEIAPESLKSLTDQQGRTLAQALSELGGDPEQIKLARRKPDDILAYLELHVEQGPQLDMAGRSLGIVTGISGIYRGEVLVHGRADHAGTTPMALRADALCAAAEVILAFEKVCLQDDSLVGTIGNMEVFPNAANVVPGQAKLGLEVRSLQERRIKAALDRFEVALGEIAKNRRTTIDFSCHLSSSPVSFPAPMTELMASICQSLNLDHQNMPSGAGHDASHLAEITKAGMIFVPSKGGRSHCPEEWTDFEDIALGSQVMAEMVAALDKEPAS